MQSEHTFHVQKNFFFFTACHILIHWTLYEHKTSLADRCYFLAIRVPRVRVMGTFSVSIGLVCSLFSMCKSSMITFEPWWVRSSVHRNAVHLTGAVLRSGLFKEVHVVVPDHHDWVPYEDSSITSLHGNYTTTVAVKSFSSFQPKMETRPAECKSHRRSTKTSSYKVVLAFRPTESALIDLLYDSSSLPSAVYILALGRGPSERLKNIIRKAWKCKYIFRVIMVVDSSSSSSSSNRSGGGLVFDPFSECERGGSFRRISTLNYGRVAEHLTREIRLLNGCRLTVSMYPREQTAVLLDNRTFTGQDGRLIELLAEKMNFTPAINLMKGKMTYGYRVVNGTTYEGTFANLIDGTADISLNGHFMKDYNCDIVELSRQITSDRVCLLTPKAGVVPPIITVLKSFQLDVWAMIMVTYIIVVISHYLVTNFGVRYMRQTSPTGCILALEIYRIMVASSLNRRFERTSEKVRIVTICTYSLHGKC